jgi:hypothetical protein
MPVPRQDRPARDLARSAERSFVAPFVVLNLFGSGLVCCVRRDWQSVRWVGNVLVYLGMVGTVLRPIMTIGDISAGKAQSFLTFRSSILLAPFVVMAIFKPPQPSD